MAVEVLARADSTLVRVYWKRVFNIAHKFVARFDKTEDLTALGGRQARDASVYGSGRQPPQDASHPPGAFQLGRSLSEGNVYAPTLFAINADSSDPFRLIHA
jgi:hypothetical protein